MGAAGLRGLAGRRDEGDQPGCADAEAADRHREHAAQPRPPSEEPSHREFRRVGAAACGRRGHPPERVARDGLRRRGRGARAHGVQPERREDRAAGGLITAPMPRTPRCVLP